jgi:beta-galactosidase beta subunit
MMIKEKEMTNDQMKKYTLGNMAGMLDQLRQKVDVLNALDNDSTASGAYDLHDQLTTMYKTLENFDAVVKRAVAVVPSK